MGDIAIDDLSLVDGECPFNTVYGCDFDENSNICGFTSDTVNSDFKWTRSSGATSTLNTGPSVDHTTSSKTGHFMYIEATRQKKGDKARLLTPLYSYYQNGFCLSMFYHMFGNKRNSVEKTG